MDVDRRTARRSSPQRNNDINSALSRTQPLPARVGALSSTGGNRQLSATYSSPIIRSDPYNPVNRKRHARAHEDDVVSLSTSSGDESLASTSRRSSLSPSAGVPLDSPVGSQHPRSLNGGSSASHLSFMPSRSPITALSTSGNDLTTTHRRSSAASTSHVTVRSKPFLM